MDVQAQRPLLEDHRNRQNDFDSVVVEDQRDGRVAAAGVADWRAAVLRRERIVAGLVFALVVTDEMGGVAVVQQVLHVLKDLRPTRHQRDAEDKGQELSEE
ncbi:MAG: hypothetical protein AB8H79_21830 [Myxococcota bacterium]